MAVPIPHRAAPYEEFFFSWGSRHHCPMEVGVYGSHWSSWTGVQFSSVHAVNPPLRRTNCCCFIKLCTRDATSCTTGCTTGYILRFTVITVLIAFNALTLLAGRQKKHPTCKHPACKNWAMRCWCGYLYRARCRLFAYGATATSSPFGSLKSRISYLKLSAYQGCPRKEAVKGVFVCLVMILFYRHLLMKSFFLGRWLSLYTFALVWVLNYSDSVSYALICVF